MYSRPLIIVWPSKLSHEDYLVVKQSAREYLLRIKVEQAFADSQSIFGVFIFDEKSVKIDLENA